MSELSEALKKANMNLPDDEIRNIIDQIDVNGDNEINYSEFITATINTKDLLTDQRIEAIFQSFDIDKTGKLTAQNILDVFSTKG